MHIKIIDAHTHVQFSAFEKDYKTVIERAFDHEIGLINVGTQKDTSRRAVEIANEYETGVWATVGLHPIHTEQSYHDAQEIGKAMGFVSRGEVFDKDHYKDLAVDPKVVAIGECGLDYYRLGEQAKKKQFAAFEAQIDFAREIDKPLMIHCRKAFKDLIEILKAQSSKLKADCPGAIHFFSGTKDEAKELLNLGFSFTFGGVITFPPKAGQPRADAPNYDEVVRYLPIESILLETDAPYVAPAPYRGMRNEPMYIVEVAKKIAELKQLGYDEVAQKTTENVSRVFNIS